MIKILLLVLLSSTYGSNVALQTNPMFDPYIETITRMNLEILMNIPEKSDEQFLNDLIHGDDSIEGLSSRTVVPTENDIKRMDQVVAQAEIDENWEILLVAGPIVVNYLGNLMVLASKEDFPFKAASNYEFRYIRFPDSFRATLAQVASEMSSALTAAHTAMDRIQVGVKQIPGHVKTTLKLLTSGSPTMIMRLLPLTINHIGRLANDSASLADKIVGQFTALLSLLDEISQLSITTGSANKVQLKNNEKQLKESIAKQQQIAHHLSDVQKQYKAAQEELAAAREAYNTAFHAIPNGGAISGSTPRMASKSSLSLNMHPSAADASLLPQSSRSITGIIAGVSTVLTVLDSAFTLVGKIFGLGEKEKEPIDNTAHTNAMEKAKLALERLRGAEEAHKKQFELHLLEQNNLAATMQEMAQLDLSKLSTEDIGAILVNATKQIIDIRVQWAKLGQFFLKLSVQADSTQKVMVEEFVKAIEVVQLDNQPLEDSDRAFFLEMIIPTVALIDREAGLLYTMAATYYKVSGEYILNQIGGIQALLVMQTDPERQQQLQLTSSTTTVNARRVSALSAQMRAQFVQEKDALEHMYKTYVIELSGLEFESIIG